MQYRQATAESNQHFNNPHHLVLHCISNVSLVIALDWILKEEVSWLHTSVTVSACQWSLVTLAAESTSQHRFFVLNEKGKDMIGKFQKLDSNLSPMNITAQFVPL